MRDATDRCDSDSARALAATDRERGMALVVVLWVIASLALLVSTFNMLVRSDGTVTRNGLQTARMEALVEGAVEIAVAQLAAAPRIPGWQPDGSVNQTRVGDSSIAIRIRDANALVDLNKSDGVLIYNLIKSIASPSEAAAVRDYVLARRRAVAPDAAPGTPSIEAAFLDVEELLRAPDMTPALLAEIRPFVTVHGQHGAINPRTAPVEVLRSVPGVESQQVDALVAARDDDLKLVQTISRIGGEASRFLKTGTGPAYLIDIAAAGHGFARPVRGQVAIMISPDGDAPFYTLSSAPIGY